MSEQTEITGRLMATPELRQSQGQGKPVTTLFFAADVGHFDEEHQWVVDRTDKYEVTAWDNLARAVTANFRRGDRLTIRGRQGEPRRFTPEGGEEQVREQMTADKVLVNAFEVSKITDRAVAEIGRSEGTTQEASIA